MLRYHQFLPKATFEVLTFFSVLQMSEFWKLISPNLGAIVIAWPPEGTNAACTYLNGYKEVDALAATPLSAFDGAVAFAVVRLCHSEALRR